jgi:predicted permease
VDRQPGVVSSALATLEPLGLSDRDMSVFFENPTSPSSARGVSINYNAVGETYFQTMSIPILAGRGFTQTSNQHSPPVVVVNETMARRFWPGVRNVVGRRISLTSANGPFLEIVGVCGNSKYISVAEQPLPYFYLPIAQNFPMTLTLVAAGTVDPAQLLRILGAQAHRLDGTLPLYHAEAMRQRIRGNLTIEDFVAKVLTFFGLTALLLATVGIYAVLSELVQQRTRETGIRIALGATKTDVLLQMMRRGVAIAAGGLVAGIATSYLVSSALGTSLIQVDPTDPLVFGFVTGLLALAALLASLLPSYRAARVDPIVTLRYD